MPNLPYMPFYPGEWKKDPCVQKCSLSTRGFWLEILLSMHQSDESGVISGTVSELARITGCQLVDCEVAIEELKRNKVCDISVAPCNANVTPCNEIVTLVNRRMNRAFKKRNNSSLRVKRFREKRRCNGVSSYSSSYIRDKEIPLSRDKEKMPRPLVSKKLDTPEFWEAWDAWVGHWAEKRKPLTSAQKDEHIRQLAHEESAEKAVETLRHSIQVSTKPMLFKKWAEKQPGAKPNQQAQRIRAEDYKEDF